MSWIKCSPTGELPAARAFHAASVLSEDRMVVFGGLTLENGKEKYLNDTWIFDNTLLKWRELSTTGTAPKGRVHCTINCLTDENKIILFGGFDGTDFLNDMWELDLQTSVWANIKSTGCPSPRAGHSTSIFSGSLGATLILFGGRGEVSYHNDLYLLDLKKYTWIKPLTSGDGGPPRAYSGAAVEGKNLYIVGGEIFYKSLETREMFADIYTLHSVSMRWNKTYVYDSKDHVNLSPRVYSTTTFYNNCIYVFGGLLKDETYDGHLYCYHLEKGSWSKYKVHSILQQGKYLPFFYGHSTVLLHHNKFFHFGGDRKSVV